MAQLAKEKTTVYNQESRMEYGSSRTVQVEPDYSK